MRTHKMSLLCVPGKLGVQIESGVFARRKLSAICVRVYISSIADVAVQAEHAYAYAHARAGLVNARLSM